MCLRLLLFIALLVGLSLAASAGPITYVVSINSSSVTGTVGSLDFQFNPGPLVSQSASLQVLSFSSNGALAGGPSVIGDVSGGPLPTTVTFDNRAGFSDYFQGFTFGSLLSFNVLLSGPALVSPDG